MTTDLQQDPEPIHGWFELTYASYLVLPRSILQSAPAEWQRRFVECLHDLDCMFGTVPKNGTYHVQLKDRDGKFIHDDLMDYERGRRRVEMIRCNRCGNNPCVCGN